MARPHALGPRSILTALSVVVLVLVCPAAAQASTTTCQVVSVPASTRTVVYSSGDVAIFPATTYSALTTVHRTDEATVRAKCFTLASGQTLSSQPASIPAGVSCKTTSQPATTYTITYTSGEVDIFLRSTRTADSTRIQTLQPTTLVTCNVLPDFQNPDTCNTVTAFTWITLVITFISVQLTWWIFDLPLIWKKGMGWKVFLDSISWACVRAHSPGSAGVIAAGLGTDAGQFARIYYLGLKREESPAQWKTWKLWTCIGSDLLNIANCIMTIYQACTLPALDAKRAAGLGLWVYPTLPVSMIGLCLLLGERTFPRSVVGNYLLLGFTLAMLAGAATAATLVLKNFDLSGNNGSWIAGVIFFSYMSFPMVFLGPALFIACLLAALARVGGVGFAALNHYSGGQPYCTMHGPGFGAVYLTLGGIAAILAAFGALYHGSPKRLLNRNQVNAEHVDGNRQYVDVK